jgi:YbbR domain-containing protein
MIPVPRRAHSIPWRRRVASAFTDRLALKASAVLLAIVLWFVVGAREPREEYAPVQFTPRLDSTLVLRDPPPPIRAHVLGRPSEILKLATQPLVIRRPIASDAPDTLVLALRPGDVEVPLGIDVIVREVYPQSVTLRFESRSARRVPVRSSILARMSLGLSQDIAVQLDPDSVTVLGPRGAVADIEFVRTVVDSIVVDTMPHLVDLDTTGLGATVRPTQVKARFVRRRPPSPPT